MNIITSGYPYIDIDAYAGMVAYAELLNLQSKQSLAVSTAPLNESITPEILSWQAPLETAYIPSKADCYSMIDLSDPKFFEKFVETNRITEIIDHHPGFEKYWQEKLGDKAHIEPIGAAATIIYERWVNAGLVNKMSLTSARLLVAAILDNTLNFGAKITHKRDKRAYEALLKMAELPENWTEKYFQASQATVVNDIITALANDTKVLHFKTFPHPVAAGQLVVWDGRAIQKKHKSEIIHAFASYNHPWFLNLISIQEKRSYFMCEDPGLTRWLSNSFDITFNSVIGVANRLWLRKELITHDINVK